MAITMYGERGAGPATGGIHQYLLQVSLRARDMLWHQSMLYSARRRRLVWHFEERLAIAETICRRAHYENTRAICIQNYDD